MPALIWKLALLLLLAVLLGGAVADLLLYLTSRPTISDWLRLHPGWFAWPAALMVAFLTGLTLHLFVFPEGF